MSDKKEGIVEKPELVDTDDLIEITDHVDLKAYLREDEVMGLHLVLYANRGDERNAVGVNVHPSVSGKFLNQFNRDGTPK